MPTNSLEEQRDDDVNTLRDLQQQMLEAFEEFKNICKNYKTRGLPIENYNAYVFSQLEIAMSSEHGYATRDSNLSEVIEDLLELDLSDDDDEYITAEEHKTHADTVSETPCPICGYAI